MTKKVLTIITVLFISTFFFSFTPGENDKVRWYTWEEAVEASKKEKRKIVVDVYTNWCGWCKRMDKGTFNDAKIAKYLNNSFYAVKLDAEQRKDIIYKGQTFKYEKQGRRGYNKLAIDLLNGKMSFPTVVLLDENFSRVLIAPGYSEASAFEKILRFTSQEHYKKGSWQDFIAKQPK